VPLRPILIEDRGIFCQYKHYSLIGIHGSHMRLHALMTVCIALRLIQGSPVRADNLDATAAPTAAAAQREESAPKETPEHRAKTEAPSSKSATGTSAGPAPAQATDESQRSAIDPAEDRHLRALGYTREMHNGVPIYCRQEAPLGSRFEQKTCTTTAQHSKSRQNSKEMLEGAQRLQVNPAGH
jgi:hypothetical protein